jgi:CRP/FNR family cyclic AMP-dependent transcriptional regulator
MTGVEDPHQLAGIPLFEGLDEADLLRLNQRLLRKSFRPGSFIITVEKTGELVYMLLEGTVKIFVDQIDGSEVILAFLGVGDTFGEMSLLDSAGRSANVLALEQCRCLAMNRMAFSECLRTMPHLSYNLVQLLTRRLRLANEQIKALSTLDVRGRVARQILAFAEQYGRDDAEDGVRIPLRLTQSDIAALVGASRERVNQVIVDFKESGLISVDPRHHITVHDRDALVDRCQ